VLSGIEDAVKKKATIKRVCIQALNYPTVLEDILNLVNEILLRVAVPISVSCQPLQPKEMQKLMEAGVDRISIPLDAATEELFNKVKGPLAGGPYLWEEQLKALKEAVQIFGKGHVSTHLIVGLGETEKEMVKTIQWCVNLGVYPGLFAFTPVSGTALENQPQPPLSQYRRLQLAHHLITKGSVRCENMSFDGNGRLMDFGVSTEQLWKVIRDGGPFVTSGCPNCNRPYYNERPCGPLYNYPRQPLPKEIVEIEKQIFSQ
jgi:biotin synthase